MIKYSAIVFLLFPILIFGQNWKSRPASLEVFSNATLLPPASLFAVARQPIHPGLLLGYEFKWKENPKGKWFETVKLGYFYHQFASQNLQLYTDFGYQRYIRKFAFRGSLLAGYMSQFPLSRKLVLQSDGQYKIQNVYMRPQFMGGAELGTSYNINSIHFCCFSSRNITSNCSSYDSKNKCK